MLAFAGDETWHDYTFRLKLRRIAGSQGLNIAFHARNGEHLRWKIGDRGNACHVLEGRWNSWNEPFDEKSGKIDNDRWYDIRIETMRGRIRCFLDNEKIHDVPCPPGRSLFAVASHIAASRELALKIVNVAARPVTADVNLPRGEKDRTHRHRDADDLG